MPKTDLEKVAEARAFTRARKAKERAVKKRAHNKKMLAAVRAGDYVELARLRTINPLAGPSKRSIRKRCSGLDIFFGKQVSMTYVSDITMDNDTDWNGAEYFDGYHRWQVERSSALVKGIRK